MRGQDGCISQQGTMRVKWKGIGLFRGERGQTQLAGPCVLTPHLSLHLEDRCSGWRFKQPSCKYEGAKHMARMVSWQQPIGCLQWLHQFWASTSDPAEATVVWCLLCAARPSPHWPGTFWRPREYAVGCRRYSHTIQNPSFLSGCMFSPLSLD